MVGIKNTSKKSKTSCMFYSSNILDGFDKCDCKEGEVFSKDGSLCKTLNPCTNNSCSQICHHNESEIYCSCRKGFEVAFNDHTQCQDIDECANDNM